MIGLSGGFFHFDPQAPFGMPRLEIEPVKPYVRKYSDNFINYGEKAYAEACERLEMVPRKISGDPIDFRIKYKTEICKYWVESGACPFRDSVSRGQYEL